jgi:hypothetical protein
MSICTFEFVLRPLSKTTIVISTLEMGTVNINEKNMMFGFNMGGKHEFLLNTLILASEILHYKNYSIDLDILVMISY